MFSCRIFSQNKRTVRFPSLTILESIPLVPVRASTDMFSPALFVSLFLLHSAFCAFEEEESDEEFALVRFDTIFFSDSKKEKKSTNSKKDKANKHPSLIALPYT